MGWIWLFGFLAVQVGIGLWASRGVNDEADYFVAGRRLGTPVVAFSLFATWFGAETCLGASGAVFSDGLSGARADPFGYALCLLLMGLFFARRFSEGGFLTLGDLYRRRFGVRAEKLAVLVLMPSTLVWGAAQVRAFGQVLATTSQIDVDTAVLVSAALVIGYTFVGGLMGDVVTDLVQGGILVIGLGAVGVAVALNLPDGATEAMTPDRLRWLPADESVWVQLDRWSVPIFGSLIAQELLARVLAARTPRVARNGALIASGIYIVVGAIPIALGLIGPALVAPLDEPERLLIVLAHNYLPYALYMIFSCALMGAILSTVDSILLSTSALISHNVLVPWLGVTDERTKLRLGRAVVMVAGAFCYVVAVHADRVYDLVEAASALGTAGILVTTVVGLYSRRGGERAAITALLLGLVVTPIVEYGLHWPAPFLTTLAVSAAGYALAARIWPPAAIQLH